MNTSKVKLLRWLVFLFSATLLFSGCSEKADPVAQADKRDVAAGIQTPSISEVKAIAEEGFIYGLPLVTNYAINYDFFVNRNSGQWKAPFNKIFSESRVFTYKDKSVVVPNSDTPYSMLGMDLRVEPLVISIPAVDKKRYFSVQLVDANTFNFGYMGSRATGSEAGSYMVVGPDWQGETPAGIKKVFRSSTQFALAIFRTQLFGPTDMLNVKKVQLGYKSQSLSAFLNQPKPIVGPSIDYPKIDKELVKTNFFEYLDFVLQFAPAGPEEKDIRAKLARIGVGSGKTLNFKDLSVEHTAAIVLGMTEGEKKVEEKVAQSGKNINGWNVGSAYGDRDFYQGNWLLRAAAAKAGIYGNSADEAMYPMTRKDVNGNDLDGSKHNYTLTFAANQLPPVNAFWSLTMYDGKTQLLIENPIGRYLINSPMLSKMKKNKDGSLTIYIQKASPGKAKEANWLPAPDGPIYLVMRLYWPKTGVPSILPPGEGTWKTPGVVESKSKLTTATRR